VADRTAIEQLSVEHPGLDLATAYWIQRELRSAAGRLRGRDRALRGLTAAVPVGAGDVVVASVHRLGSIELACRWSRGAQT
jgi:2-oxo-3-hexenedioate decarboxylase